MHGRNPVVVSLLQISGFARCLFAQFRLCNNCDQIAAFEHKMTHEGYDSLDRRRLSIFNGVSMISRAYRSVTAVTSAFLGLASLTCSESAFAQANYTQSFQGVGDGNDAAGGPPSLVSQGWIFRNQSRPAGSGVSPYWTEFPAGWGHVGPALGHGGFIVWQGTSSRVSAWIILPAIPNQVAGDPFTFWSSAPTDAFGHNGASLEVRYSPTGGTSTGSNETSVGNFTTLLSTISGAGGHDWTQRAMSLPGNGRIALRLMMGPASNALDFSGSMMIDTLRVGNPPPLPYPIPTAGQTVHWTTAMSPVLLNMSGTGQSPRIVPTATVIVDPGVEVRLGNGVVFDVSGTLNLAGTAASPVRLRGASGSAGGWARISVANGGLMSATHADIETFTDLIYGGKASFTDTAFRDPSNPTDFSYDSAGDVGHRFFDGNLAYARQVLSLTRCTFGQGCSASILRGWLAATDTTFFRGSKVTNDPGAVGGEAMYVTGKSILKNVTATEAFLDLYQTHDQYHFLGDITATGNPNGPGIRINGGGNYLIDPSVTLQSNRWPVRIGFNSAGILPGSQLPATGNTLNEIPDTDDPAPNDERTIWADAGVPYIAYDNGVAHGKMTILPGVTVKVLPDVIFGFDTDSNGFAQPVFLGEPERPIRFMPYTPGTKWAGIGIGNVRWQGTRWDWCVIEDATYGVSSVEMPMALDNCVFRRNLRGAGGSAPFTLRKCTFEDNVFSYSGERFAPNHVIDGYLDANHPANPNTFINNRGNPGPDYFSTFLPNGGLAARARHNSLEHTDSDARNNWWGTTTGPHHPTFNPTGTGDDVFFGIDVGGFLLPFLTQPPSNDPPPVVRFVTQYGIAVIPGEKIQLQWTARDNGSIVSQRVYYSPQSNMDNAMQLLAEVPASARSFEWIPPVIGTPANGPDQFLRVVSVDNLGQEGIADVALSITNPAPFTGNMIPTSPVAGTYRPGDSRTVCANVTGVVGSTYASIELDNDETATSLGGLFISGSTACTILPAELLDVSTDRARIRYDATGSLNQVKSFYGPYFSIRPDPMLGDQPPVVALVNSPAGQLYSGGSTVPISWTASDDESLRSFDIRASFNGGTRWFIVARDLPGTARNYNWQLPASQGIADVRVRVVAKDRRFQNTSADSGAFVVAAGQPSTCDSIDFNNDTSLFDPQDIEAFLSVYSEGPCVPATATCNDIDFNNDTSLFDPCDISSFLLMYSEGPCTPCGQ